MTPEVAYNLINDNKECCFKIYASSGHNLTAIEQTKPETALAQLREKINLLAPEHKSLIVYGGKDKAHCNNKDGHTYYIEVTETKSTTGSTVTTAPIVSGVPFETVLGLLSKKDDTISTLQAQVAAAQLADVKREIELLKNKKEKPSEISEMIGAAKELLPMLATLKNGGLAAAARPGIGNADTQTARLTFEEMKILDVNALTGIFNQELQKMQQSMGPIDGIAYIQLVNSRPADVIRMAKFLLANPDKIDLLLTLIPADFK